MKRKIGFWLSGLLSCSTLMAQPLTVPAPEPRDAAVSATGETAVPAAPGTPVEVTDDDVLLNGPLHEAFGTPVSPDPIEQPVVPRQPPEALNELPPEIRPEGENVIWIPGYWSFDRTANEYLWVSGLWRAIPPGRRWVPGYWTEVADGFRWTSGMWLNADVEDLTWQPAPPASMERGPSSPSPGDNYFWVPGCWMYSAQSYRWRPGYWAPHQTDWVWCPDYYVYTPRGYIYCDGYWDYDVGRRGMLFAPVRYRSGFNVAVYRPTVSLNIGSLFLNLWVDEPGGRYCYGNYFGVSHYRPWYDFRSSRGWCDPIYSHNSWRFGSGYHDRLSGWNRYFASHPDYRPRSSYRDQVSFTRQNSSFAHLDQIRVGRSLSEMRDRDHSGRSLVRLDDNERRDVQRTLSGLRDFSSQRRGVEGLARDGTRGGDQDRSRGDRPDFRTGRTGSDRPDDADRSRGLSGSWRLPESVHRRVPSFSRDGLPDSRSGFQGFRSSSSEPRGRSGDGARPDRPGNVLPQTGLPSRDSLIPNADRNRGSDRSPFGGDRSRGDGRPSLNLPGRDEQPRPGPAINPDRPKLPSGSPKAPAQKSEASVTPGPGIPAGKVGEAAPGSSGRLFEFRSRGDSSRERSLPNFVPDRSKTPEGLRGPSSGHRPAFGGSGSARPEGSGIPRMEARPSAPSGSGSPGRSSFRSEERREAGPSRATGSAGPRPGGSSSSSERSGFSRGGSSPDRGSGGSGRSGDRGGDREKR